MNRDEFDEFFKKNEGQFIIGIHNYCDRWCERCQFTNQCSVYQIDEERARKRAEKGIPDNDFTEIVSENFQIVMDMMEDMMKDQGFDLEQIDVEAIEAEEKAIENLAKNHPLSKNSEVYLKEVRLWLDENETILKTYEQEFRNTQELGLKDSKIIDDYEKIYEAIEIINWYHALIHVKLMRALRNRTIDLSYEDLIQNDANGTAKIALISTEKSIGAWGILHRQIPELEDVILKMLILLEKIRKDVLKEFPNARSFIRPGFDDQMLS